MKERILVVDDETNARTGLSTLLAEEGYEVKEAADGEQALALIPAFNPAVVLVDVRMPHMDGLTLLDRAKQAGADAALLMMTALASVALAGPAMARGGENFFTKPLGAMGVTARRDKTLEKPGPPREGG